MELANRAATGLRDELGRYVETGLLTRVPERVGARFEACAIAAELGSGAVLFEDVDGHRVAMNTTASRQLIATSLGIGPAQVAQRYLDALQDPVAPVESEGPAPVHEVTVLGDDIDLRRLPVLTHHEHDNGPYITSGVVLAEADGLRNLSYHRMQVRSARETGIVVVQRHLHRMLDEADAAGRPFPVAVAIGLDAGMLLAAATSGSAAPYGFDELGIVGALRGQPVELVGALTIPVQVPALAEYVIEGHILPNLEQAEGPFAEFDGSYESGPARVFRATAVTHRTRPVYHGLVSGSIAQLNIMGLPNEAVILKSVRAVVPTVRAVHVTRGGLRKFHAVISVDKRTAGDGADAIVAAFAGHRDLKHVVVVDGDVDPFDGGAVEQAVATSFQAHRDLVVVPGGRGNPVDRSLAPDGTTARMGLDATRPLGADARVPAVIPGRTDVDVSRYVAATTL
jgi:2,5-furandicarboxylate decarboxylase 1